MSMPPADCSAAMKAQAGTGANRTVLEKFLQFMSIATMLMTVPQVVSVWDGGDGGASVSVLSWGAYLFSACLWFVYGLKKRDKTIYLNCIGWIALDAAIIIGALLHR